MHGIAPPLVTPFTEDGDLDTDRLRQLVGWLEDRGVHFLVPCGSTSEAELMTFEERVSTIEAVAEEASVPVLAGCGHPGYRETNASIEAAAEAGADGAMIVTPFYYNHDQATLAAYYRDMADDAALPIYLYSVPIFTDVTLEPDTVGDLATHPNIVGMKDSLGDLGSFIQTVNRTETEEFQLMTGSTNLLTAGMETGGTGAILALANLAPEGAVEVFEHLDDEPAWAHERTAQLVELNAIAPGTFGIPGLKWAMRERGAPAGFARRPFTPSEQPAKTAIRDHLETLNLV